MPSLANVNLQAGVTVQTLSGGVVSESFSDNSTLMSGALAGSSDQGLLKLTPTKTCDAVRINIAGTGA